MPGDSENVKAISRTRLLSNGMHPLVGLFASRQRNARVMLRYTVSLSTIRRQIKRVHGQVQRKLQRILMKRLDCLRFPRSKPVDAVNVSLGGLDRRRRGPLSGRFYVVTDHIQKELVDAEIVRKLGVEGRGEEVAGADEDRVAVARGEGLDAGAEPRDARRTDEDHLQRASR